MNLAICGGMHLTIDGFRLCYCIIAGFMWAMTLLFSPEYMKHHDNKVRYYIFMVLTGIATAGVFLSADLYTLFIFFEIMSFTSFVWVAQEETKEAIKAAKTYLAVAVIGGLVMLMGMFLLYHFAGTLDVEKIGNVNASSDVVFAIGCLLIFGFGAKAGAFPLHIWLPKAHPVAPAPASALLSGILTKTGVFGIIIVATRLLINDERFGLLVLSLGTITMFLGALLGVFSIDLKRTLACSSMSQIGFILVGVGSLVLLEEEKFLAAQGAFLHMINHSLIKLVLFMVAGAVYMKTHSLDLNKIQGYGRKKPFLHFLFLSGALTIMGIPGFGGYISKTLLHEGLVELGYSFVEWIFLISGGLTICYCSKLYICIFVQKNSDEELQKKYDETKAMNALSGFSIGLSAVTLLVFGRSFVMNKVGELGQKFLHIEGTIEELNFWSFENLKGALISISIGLCLYAIVFYKAKFTGLKQEKLYTNIWPKRLDLENLVYKPVLLRFLPVFFAIWCRVFDSLVDTVIVVLRKTVYKDSPLPRIRMEGTVLTDIFGKLFNWCNRFRVAFLEQPIFNDLNISKARLNARKKLEIDYVHVFATRHESRKEDVMIIERSLSFGLFMFCIGLTLTLVYLVFM